MKRNSDPAHPLILNTASTAIAGGPKKISLHMEERADCGRRLSWMGSSSIPPRPTCDTHARTWAAHTSGIQQLSRWSPILDFMPLQGFEPDGRGVDRIWIHEGSQAAFIWPPGPIPTPLRPMAPSCARTIGGDISSGQMCRSNSVAMRMAAATVNALPWTQATGAILYLGTRHDGLWRSADRAKSWTRITSFPDITEAVEPAPPPMPGETPREHYERMPVHGDGIVFVKFLPGS